MEHTLRLTNNLMRRDPHAPSQLNDPALSILVRQSPTHKALSSADETESLNKTLGQYGRLSLSRSSTTVWGPLGPAVWGNIAANTRQRGTGAAWVVYCVGMNGPGPAQYNSDARSGWRIEIRTDTRKMVWYVGTYHAPLLTNWSSEKKTFSLQETLIGAMGDWGFLWVSVLLVMNVRQPLWVFWHPSLIQISTYCLPVYVTLITMSRLNRRARYATFTTSSTVRALVYSCWIRGGVRVEVPQYTWVWKNRILKDTVFVWRLRMVKGERKLHMCFTDLFRTNFRSSIWVLRNAARFKPPTVVPTITFAQDCTVYVCTGACSCYGTYKGPAYVIL